MGSTILEKLARPLAYKDAFEDDTGRKSRDGQVPEAQLVGEIVQSLQQEQWLRCKRPPGLDWAKEPANIREVKRRLAFLKSKSDNGACVLDTPLTNFCGFLVSAAAEIGILERTEEKRSSGEANDAGVRDDVAITKMVCLTEDGLKLIEAVPPTYSLPMISRPRPWTELRGGGYLGRAMDLVKHHNNPFVVKALEGANLTLVYQATNALQESPWQINQNIYTVVRAMNEQKLDFPGVPTAEEIQDAKDEWLCLKKEAVGSDKKGDPATMSETQKEIWTNAFEARTRYRHLGLKRFIRQKLISDRLYLCSRLIERDKKTFFFPYQLDFRGRAYAVPQCLSPQSDDLGRALLEFANGKPLGARGAYWLAVHLANMWGGEERIDKRPFEERVDWVKKNENAIIQSADSPLEGDPIWRKAKKPWRFLAACMEWKGYRKDGSSFTSHLPVAMDGTCNGFQHLSAMLRDPKGVEATNLLRAEVPNDIYDQVAKKLLEKLRDPEARCEAMANWWVANVEIDRSLVKPGVMTTPYGAERRTKARQLIDVLVERKIEIGSRKEGPVLTNYLV